MRFALLCLLPTLALAFEPASVAEHPDVRAGVPPDHPHQPACLPVPTRRGPVRLVEAATSPPADGFGCGGLKQIYVVWPLDSARVLLTRDWSWSCDRPPLPDGVLDVVECATGDVEPFLSIRPGTDYGNAALSRDGRTLFYTGVRGVERLDLKSREVRDVTENRLNDCDPPEQVTDVVLGFTKGDRRLRIRRSYVCDAFSHPELRTTDYDVLAPFSAKPRLHAPHAVTALSVGADGAIWAVDGEDCEHECRPSQVWRSLDGVQWAALKVPTVTAPKLVVADAARAGHALVLGAEQAHGLGDSAGGELLVSADGGRRWTAVKGPTPGPGAFRAVEVIGGDLRHLRVTWSSESGSPEHPWRTRDGGAHWQPDEGEVRTAPQTVAVVDDVRYAATRDGLWRRKVGDARGATRVGPGAPR